MKYYKFFEFRKPATNEKIQYTTCLFELHDLDTQLQERIRIYREAKILGLVLMRESKLREAVMPNFTKL